MPLLIPDETLKLAKLTEREAAIEFACHLFDAGKLDLWPAAELAGLSRAEMETELQRRGIAVYRPTVEDIQQELQALRRLGK